MRFFALAADVDENDRAVSEGRWRMANRIDL